MTSKQTRMITFFQTEIKVYVLRDLASLRYMKALPKNHDGYGWCAVPLAQLLFSVLDVLGYLIRPEPNAKKSETLKNCEALFTDSRLFPSEYADRTSQLVKQFRHGCIHQFFPKAAGIARRGENRPLVTESGPMTILNVDRLEFDTIAAISKLECRINAPESESLCEQMSDRLDHLAVEDWAEFPSTP